MPDLVRRWRFPKAVQGTLFRIWPSASFSICWPGQAMIDCDAHLVAEAFWRLAYNIARGHSSMVGRKLSIARDAKSAFANQTDK